MNERERRTVMSVRRSTGGAAVETLLNAGNAEARTVFALGGAECENTQPSTVAAGGNGDDDKTTTQESLPSKPSVYIDPDVPADDAFPNAGVDNTFGDNMSHTLARLYAEAYATVHWLLFSDERAAIESRNRELVVAEARHRIDSYIAAQTKAGEPILLGVCRQLERRAVNSRRTYPELLVPEHAVARMTAYYAVVALECYLQLMSCAATLAPDASTDATKKACERFLTTSFSRVVPNVLTTLHTGLRSSSGTIAVEDAMLSIMPESQTIEELGIAQKVCTQVKKDMRKIIIAASHVTLPVASVQLTQLDTNEVIFGRASIISTFLAARRRRLHASRT
jgi:hypothetical protein